jgi:hypothetical protein
MLLYVLICFMNVKIWPGMSKRRLKSGSVPLPLLPVVDCVRSELLQRNGDIFHHPSGMISCIFDEQVMIN